MNLRRKISFEKSIPYHVLTRTVERRKIYIDEKDRCRFIFQMHAANVGKPVFNLYRQDITRAARALLKGEEIPEKLIIVEHPSLVNFLSFALVTNHYHFILTSNLKYGISKYMQKLNGGFAKYFNLRHNREGNLFEKPYKIVPVQTNFQLDAVLRYVNVKNPLDVYQPGWREKGLKDRRKAFKFLENYRFSSFPDLFGKINSKILAPHSVLKKYLGEEITSNQAEFIAFIKDYLRREMISYHPLFLEEE